jgi:hypothetical protein
MQWEESTNSPATTDLSIVFSKTITVPKIDRSSDGYFYLLPSDSYLTNLRVFSEKIESDKQPIVLNQNIVKNAHLAIVIDNAVPQSRMPANQVIPE